MTKTRSTKSALISSVIALLLCFTMLLGTTFAWFTDSVTSAGNIIQSGTLDVEMHWAEGTKDPSAADTTWTDASTGAIFNNDKWEPGYTEVRHIKIANVGTLALKYQIKIMANGEVSDLADVIDVYYVDPAQQIADRTALTDDNKLGTLTDVLANLANTANGELPAGENDTITLALKMQESAGNEYQNKSIGSDFSVILMATQLTAEKDSFNDQYDADAKYTAEIDQLNAKLAAAQSGETVEYALTHDVYLNSTVTVPAGVTLKLNGNGHTIFGDMNATGNTALFYAKNSDIHIENVTFTGSATYAVFTNGVTWEGGNTGASLTNVTVNMSTPSSYYPVNFNGKGNITLTDCTITGEGRSVDNYRNGTHVFAGAEINLTVSGGTIGGVLMNANNVHNSTLTISDSAVIDTLILATDQTKTATLTNNGGTVNKLIQQVDDAAKLEAALKAGYTAALSKDITMEAHLSSSIVGDINIYGEGHTLTLRGIYSVGGKNVTLSNMTLVDNNPNDYTIYNQGGKVELTNVTYSSNINKAFQMAGGGDVILNNCNISGDVTGTYSASNIWCGDGRNVTVNGGTYGSIFINASEGANVLSAGKITLNSGTIGKLILETEKNTNTGDGQSYKSAVLVQNGGTITELVKNPQNYDLTGLTKLN